MKTYVVQPGHVITQSGGETAYAGAEIELDDETAAQYAHAVALKPPPEPDQASGDTNPSDPA